MQVESLTPFRLFESQTQYLVPIYQREYRWEKDQWERLWADLLEIYDGDNTPAHFIGSVVLVEKDKRRSTDIPQSWVVDGQQRLATLLVFISACDITAAGKADGSSYLTITQRLDDEGRPHLRMVPTAEDRSALKAVLCREEPGFQDREHRLVRAHRFFQSRVVTLAADRDLPVGEVALALRTKAIDEITLVTITIDEGDRLDANRVFEAMHVTGLELTPADLVRNHLYWRLDGDAETVFASSWLPLQRDVSEDVLGKGIYFDSLLNGPASKVANWPPQKTYEYQRALTSGLSGDELRGYIGRMDRRTRTLHDILNVAAPSADVRLRLAQRLRWGDDWTELLALFVYEQCEQLPASQREAVVCGALDAVESVIVRRQLSGMPTTNFKRFIIGVIDSCRSSGPDQLVASVTAALAADPEWWPTDDQVHEGCLHSPFYTLGNRALRLYILERLEVDFGTKEHVDFTKLSIEHVLPQTLTDEWRHDLGDEAEAVWAKYRHTIGNLTPTGKNSEMSNKSFAEKRPVYQASNLSLARDVGAHEHWSREAILERSAALAARACGIWAPPPPAQRSGNGTPRAVRELTFDPRGEGRSQNVDQVERWVALDPRRSKAKVIRLSTRTILVWAYDGQEYSPSMLARKIVRAATGRDMKRCQGTLWWTDSTGRTLRAILDAVTQEP